MSKQLATILILLGLVLGAVIYQKSRSAISTEPEPDVDPARPAAVTDQQDQLQALRAKVKTLEAEKARLVEHNAALNTALTDAQARFTRQEPTPEFMQGQVSPGGTYPIFSNAEIVMTRQDGLIVVSDKTGRELFGFDLENQRLSFQDGLYLQPLNTILFDVPQEVRELRSTPSKERAILTFENTTQQDLYVYWMDYKGQPRHYRTLKSGQRYTQKTYLTHPWIFTDGEGNIHSEIEPLYPDRNENIIIAE